MKEIEEKTKEIDLESLKDDREDEEKETKIIETREELEENEKEEQEEIEEIENKEESNKTKTTKKETKNPNKKKLYIIISIVAVVIIVIILLLVLLLGGKKEDSKQQEITVKKESAYVVAIKSSLENQKLLKEMNKALNATKLETTKVQLLSIDIDSDGNQELIAYAEDSNKKYILKFEVTDEVSYADAYQINSKDSIGYAYSLTKDENYWFIKYSENYTIFASQKKVIKEEDFLNDYFVITNTYKNIPILDNSIEYELEKELDAKELEKGQITEEKLLKDNNIKTSEIKPAAEKYFKEKKEAEEKAKKEEEEKKKAEEEAAKKEAESSFKLEGKTLHYGKYASDPATIVGYVIINSNGSGEIDSKSCTWKFGKHDFAQDSSGTEEKESVNFVCTDGEYHFTAFNDDELGNGGEIVLKLE